MEPNCIIILFFYKGRGLHMGLSLSQLMYTDACVHNIHYGYNVDMQD